MEKNSINANLSKDIIDDLCDLDPDKICDNCMKCLTSNADYLAITIDSVKIDETK